jgi:hypothetical protein
MHGSDVRVIKRVVELQHLGRSGADRHGVTVVSQSGYLRSIP